LRAFLYGLAVTAPAIKEFVSSVRYNEAMKRINEFLNRSAWDLKRVYPYLLIALSSAALLAAMVLMVEEVHLLKNPTAQLGCDLNPIISCGSVMKSSSSHIFGIPNPQEEYDGSNPNQLGLGLSPYQLFLLRPRQFHT
jgi:hypothetical protein